MIASEHKDELSLQTLFGETTSSEIPGMRNSKPLSLFEPMQIHEKIKKKMKKKVSTVPNDIPWKIILEFSVELAEPLSHIFNSASKKGIWPSIWKKELVTPVPKVFPPKSPDDLRKIAGTNNFSKFF